MASKGKAAKMYANPPEAEQDEKGSFSVKPKKADETQAGTEGNQEHVVKEHAMADMHHRHEMEHMAMNRKHEVEHHSAKGEDGEMLERHVSEHKEMNTRHVSELKKAHKPAKGGGEPVKAGDKSALEESGPKKKAKAEKGGEKE